MVDKGNALKSLNGHGFLMRQTSVRCFWLSKNYRVKWKEFVNIYQKMRINIEDKARNNMLLKL